MEVVLLPSDYVGHTRVGWRRLCSQQVVRRHQQMVDVPTTSSSDES
jgi:hypothetical protein